MLQKIEEDKEEKYSHAWQGEIRQEIPVFTPGKDWQKAVGSKQKFSDWVKSFKPDL